MSAMRQLLSRQGALAVLAAAAYHAAVLDATTDWSDFLYRLGNWGFRNWRGLASIFSSDYHLAFWYGKGDWVPVTFLTFYASRLCGGIGPAGAHWTALALLTACAWMIALIGDRLSGRRLGGFLAGVFFLIHPLQWRSIHVSVICHLLACFFSLAAIWAYLRANRRPASRPAWTLAGCIFYLLALGSKQTAVILPGLILACDIALVPGEAPWKTRLTAALRRISPFLAAAAAFTIAYLWLHAGSGTMRGGFAGTWNVREPFSKARDIAGLLAGFSGGAWSLALCGTLLLAAAFSGRLMFLLLWSGAAAVLFLNILPIEALGRVLGEKGVQARYLLLLSAGLSLAAAAGVIRALASPKLRPAAVVLIALTAVFSLRLPWVLPGGPGLSNPLTGLFSAPFIDKRAAESLRARWRSLYGAAGERALTRLFSSGAVYSDPHAARGVMNSIHRRGLYRRSFSTLPPEFFNDLDALEANRSDWSAALDRARRGNMEAAAPLTERILLRNPRHVGALLLSSRLLRAAGRTGMASRRYLLARRETGLRHGALIRIAFSGAPLQIPPAKSISGELSWKDRGPLALYAAALEEQGNLRHAEQAYGDLARLIEKQAPPGAERSVTLTAARANIDRVRARQKK